MKENRKDTGSTDQEDDKEEVRGQKKGHEKREQKVNKQVIFICRFNNKVKQRRKSWKIKRKEKEVKRDLSLQKRKEQLVRSP